MPHAPAVATDNRLASAQLVDAAQEQAWNEGRLATPVLAPAARLWQYTRSGVVLGRSQHALLVSLDADTHRIIERSAGGGAVLVGPWMLGASVVLPLAHPLLQNETIADSYRWLGELFVAALAENGVASVSVPREATWKAPPHLAWSCFAGMSPWEVAIGNRKLVGFAQRRSRHGVLLVAGALLAPVPWLALCEALRLPVQWARELASSTIDAGAAAGRPLAVDAFTDSVLRRLARALGAPERT